jgi:hypothetical protein
MEDDDDGLRGGGSSLTDDKDGLVRGAMGVDDDGMGHATATASTFTSTSSMMASGQGCWGVLVVAFRVNTYQSGETFFMSFIYHSFSTTLKSFDFCYL